MKLFCWKQRPIPTPLTPPERLQQDLLRAIQRQDRPEVLRLLILRRQLVSTLSLGTTSSGK